MLKTCSCCLKEMDRARFRGPSKVCSECADENRKRYYAAHARKRRKSEKVKDYFRAYRKAHPEIDKAVTAKWRFNNKEKIDAQMANYRLVNAKELSRKQVDRLKQNPEIAAHRNALRRAAKNQALPKWADKKKIAQIYDECIRISADTGIPHQVDHIYPLTSGWVCGLHCEANLQILPAAVNHTKSNRPWPMTG